MAASPADRSSSRMRAPTLGWMIAFSLARNAPSENTISASRSRSRLPSARSTPSPNSATTRASPGVPGATTSLATASASMTIAPRAASRRDTSLLPEPMPPVRPTRTGRPTLPRRGLGLPAGQLVAEGGERLVGGKRAARGAVAAAPAACGRPPRAAGPGLLAAAGVAVRLGLVAGLAGLGDLAPVGLEPRPGLGVLLFPLLALLLVAFEPLAGLGVEALRVDVVALLVVGGGHAVKGGVEVVPDRLADRALVGLLERQADPAPVQVYV